MIDFAVKRMLKIIGEGGTECNYARTEILDIIHTLENQWGYEVPNMAEEFDRLESERGHNGEAN